MPRKKHIDIINNRYGRLVVLVEVGQGINYDRLFKCLCDCGTKKVFTMSDLRKGHSQSCGCKSQEHLIKMNEANESLRIDGIQPLALVRKPRINTSTGITGVSRIFTRKGTERFKAYISVGKTRHNLGHFDTLENAVIARKKGEEEFHNPIIEKAKSKKEGSQ